MHELRQLAIQPKVLGLGTLSAHFVEMQKVKKQQKTFEGTALLLLQLFELVLKGLQGL